MIFHSLFRDVLEGELVLLFSEMILIDLEQIMSKMSSVFKYDMLSSYKYWYMNASIVTSLSKTSFCSSNSLSKL